MNIFDSPLAHLSKNPKAITAACFITGSLCALGMAPYNIWPIFLIGFGTLYIGIARAANKRSAFLRGWLWAFGYFLCSLYWIGNALLVDGNPYAWAYPLAVCGLPAMLAFFNAFACLIVWKTCNLKQWYGYLGFATILGAFEVLRGHLFTGFPWNLYGYTWIDMLPIAQIASVESVYLLTFITLLWMSIAGFWITSPHKLSKRILNSLILLSFFWSFYWGQGQIPYIPESKLASVDPNAIHIKAIQPNTPQADKWDREKMPAHFATALRLSAVSDDDLKTPHKTIIVWPETTISPLFLNNIYYRDQITDMLNAYPDDVALISGALRYNPDNKTYHNSIITIDKTGEIIQSYDKSHLVPFGEYIPFQKWIPLKPIVDFQGLEKGDGVTTLSLFDNKISYSPLICYEIIFPHAATQQNVPTNLIINATNDAWYGNSAGPYQHLAIARFRAIEEGIPVIRAAGTGISAIIDPYGRILRQSTLFTEGAITKNISIK